MSQAGAAATDITRMCVTHFSQRYQNPTRFGEEAARHFDGEIVVASDLARVAVPRRR